MLAVTYLQPGLGKSTLLLVKMVMFDVGLSCHVSALCMPTLIELVVQGLILGLEII